MHQNRRITAARLGVAGMALACVVLIVVAGSFARASGAGGVNALATTNGYPMAEADQPWAYQRFLVSSQAGMDLLNLMGVDLGEQLEKNKDGTMWAYAVVTAAQRDYLAKRGYKPGSIVQTSADAAKVQAQMGATARMEKAAQRAAKTGRGMTKRALANAETIKVTRADYYQSSSGTWLSVEAKSSAAQGNAAVPPGTPGCPATGSNRCGINGGSTTGACWGNPDGGASALSTAACPVLNVAYSTDNGQTWQNGFQTQMSPDLDDGVYLYHFLLVKLALKANDATAPQLPMLVRVASNYGTVSTRSAATFLDSPPPYPSGFQHDFFDRYQTPEDGTAIIQALHAQYPDITQLIPVTYKTNGYRRNAMAAMGCTPPTAGGNTGLPGAPGASPPGFATPATCTGSTVQAAAVVLNTWKFGQDDTDPTQNGNQVTTQFVNPGAANSPLSVSVSGLAITVSLATDGAGALTSTAAQVVAALNADPSASAILWAATYRGNAGAGIVQPSAVVHLSDFLWAPQVGDPTFPAGMQVPRAPYQQYVLRICKVCDGSKTGFFVYAQEHAREWVGPLVALETANRLLKNYGTDPTTTSYVDNLDIFIDPSINTDGGNYSMLQGGASGQRRTMTRFCGPNNPAGAAGDVASTSFDPASRNAWGIDDNRGFSVGSLFDGYEGASASCTSDTYAGPGELTQPEDKNEVALETQFPNIRFSMNIHTSGGYFMWSPASYKTINREALPYPSKGWQEEFWAAARKTVTAIKNYRGTVVTPDRTGSVVDVLYSAAGNSSDEGWYNRNIIAYDFECGVRQFSPTSTSNNGGDPGFTPNFATEGRAEGQEFADGMYGLMSSALDYQNDTTAPVVTTSVPSGTVSQTPISLVFNESEPSDTYYTTDGSTPTTSSTQYKLSGFREQEGETLTFTQTTTLKWFSVDPKGNTSAVQTATFVVDSVAPTTTASVSPATPDLANGWYGVPVTVTLSATDSGSGVASTKYSIDGGAPQTYTSPFTISSEGSHTVSYWSIDNAGNTETAGTLTIKIDLNAPTTTATLTPSPQNGWYASPTLTLSGDDGAGSGVAHTDYALDGGAFQTYSGPISGFSTGNHFVQYRSTDVAGRVEATKLIAFKADSDVPTANITRPQEGDSFKLGQVVNASYKCADKQTGSGLASCVGDVPLGSPIDTSTIGDHTFTVTATDKAGNTTTATHHYTVRYPFQGFFSPVSNSSDEELNLTHAGDLIRIGFGLGGDRGLDIFQAGFPTSTPVACPSWAAHLVNAAGPGATAGLSFSSASGHYVYGWQTSAAWAGTCREFQVVVKDGSARTATFLFFA
jgi:hypothetical protein